MLIIVSYLPWIILDSWKSKTSANCFVRLVLLDFQSQILTSHAVFNCRAYIERVYRIILCKSSSFSICDVTSRGTLPTPQALRPNTFNNCSEVDLTKAGFGNGGHCFVTTTRWFHLRNALARARLTTFWSFRLYTAIDALPTPYRTQMWVQVKDNRRRRSWDALPSSQHFEG